MDIEQSRGKDKWYTRTWFTIAMLLTLWIIGLFIMWKYKNWPIATKTAISIAYVVGFLLFMNLKI